MVFFIWGRGVIVISFFLFSRVFAFFAFSAIVLSCEQGFLLHAYELDGPCTYVVRKKDVDLSVCLTICLFLGELVITSWRYVYVLYLMVCWQK